MNSNTENPKDDKLSFQTPLLLGTIFTLFFLFSENFLTAIGLGWSVFIFFLFVSRLGKGFPVLELMLLMAAAQWIVGAKIAYVQDFEHWKYFMYVNELEYMKLAVPGAITMSLGVFLFYPRYSFSKMNKRLRDFMSSNKRLAYILIIFGLMSDYVGPYAPASLGFVFYLTKSFQYVGLALLLFAPRSGTNWYWFIGVMGLLTISSIIQGMFHDLILWSALLFSFICIRLELSSWGKFSYIVIGLMAVFLIQSVKGEYRGQIVGYSDEKRIELFTDLIGERIDNPEFTEEEGFLEMTNVRLNQGWIISAVINNIPRYEPFAEGETITTAIRASLIPRIIDPDKPIAGGRENFRRFTGLPIRDDTSMGTSILGEAYANFGNTGAYIFMFIWGAFLAWGFGRLIKYGRKYPIIIVFIPMIFLQVIKAETELVVVLNHFVKSLILVFAFLWFARKFLGWQLKQG